MLFRSLLQSASKKLNEQRRLRPRPHLDDKVITAWNGMMLAAYAKASTTFDDVSFLNEAIQAVDFIKTHLYDKKTGKLYRQYRVQSKIVGGSVDAVLSDYVWTIYGLLEVHRASNDRQWLDWALELKEKQDALFLDKSSGVYFESTADDTNILFRSKSIYDGALPSPNAIALSNLRRLSQLLHEPSKQKTFSSAADRLVNSFAAAINENQIGRAHV